MALLELRKVGKNFSAVQALSNVDLCIEPGEALGLMGDDGARPKYKDKIASGALSLVVADTLPIQIELMKKGLSAGQVGQRPFEMGYKGMYFLKDMKDGKAAPKDPPNRGLDVCTPKNVDTCIGG